MLYKSPIRPLLSFLNKKEDLNTVDFNVLKKRIFAEFELKGRTTLKTPLGDFSKNDFIQAFELYKVTTDLQKHKFIASYPALLELLENRTVKDQLSFADPFFKDEEFVRFLSPYLAYALGQYFSGCIKKSKQTIIFDPEADLPILKTDLHLMVQPVYKEIREIADLIDGVKLYISDKEKSRAKKYFNNHIVASVSRLPRAYFKTTIDLYVASGTIFIGNHWTLTYNTRRSFKIYAAKRLTSKMVT